MLFTIYEDTHLWVPWAAVNAEQLMADLTIVNLSVQQARTFGQDSGAPDRVAMWEDHGEWVRIPRGYNPPYLPGVEVKRVKRLPFPAKREPWPFLRTFRPHQFPAAEAMLRKRGDKLLCMGCGKGKTTMALWYASEKAQRTLVIVDRDFLITQWKKEITDCLGILEGEIGHVQASKRIIGDKLTVAMGKTLAGQEFDDDFYRQFGLVIFDEAHVMAAPTFIPVVSRFSGERLLLTATPDRRDGLDPLFRLHGGGNEPCYRDLSRRKGTRWFFKRLPAGLLDEREMARCMRPMPGGAVKRRVVGGKVIHERQMMLMRPRYETYFAQSVVANTAVLNEVERAARSGRHVLFLGTRVEQLEYFHGYFSEGLDLDAGLVTGRVKGDLRTDALTHRLLFITTSIGNKALDVPRLDTLCLLYPTDDVGFIRQAVGRIDREMDGKKEPIAVVFHHTGVRSLERKSEQMIDAIRTIDPDAEVRYV